MAVIKAKRSVHLRQAARRNNRRATNRHPERGKPAERRNQTRTTSLTQPHSSLARFSRFPHTRFFHYRQARGKTVEKEEFSASVDHHDITIWFTDKTSLNFSIEAGFTLKTQYSDWKSGEQRIVRSWPLFRSHT